MKPLLFVYGSLRKGQQNHHRLKDAKFIGNATIKHWVLYSLGSYPAIKWKQGSKLIGEVYEVEHESFERINLMEKNANYAQVVELADIEGLDIAYTVYVYVYKGKVEEKNLVASGDWVKFVNEKNGENKMTKYKTKVYEWKENKHQKINPETYSGLLVEEEICGEAINIFPPKNIRWDYCIVVNKQDKSFYVEELCGA